MDSKTRPYPTLPPLVPVCVVYFVRERALEYTLPVPTYFMSLKTYVKALVIRRIILCFLHEVCKEKIVLFPHGVWRGRADVGTKISYGCYDGEERLQSWPLRAQFNDEGNVVQFGSAQYHHATLSLAQHCST